MNFLPEEIENYANAHTKSEPDVLARLNHETWQKMIAPRMLSGHFQGRLLSMIAHMIKPKRILEIGTYTGYSAICLAEGLAEDGVLITIDINDELKWIQDKYFAMSENGFRIERHFGDALEMLHALNTPVDLVFMDADKQQYLDYYEVLMRKMKSGSYILIDNVLWSGKVLAEPHPQDLDTRVMRELNEKIVNDNRVENILLPIRDGLQLIRVK
jgi:caffeoyl-CoA O-methyltransferase